MRKNAHAVALGKKLRAHLSALGRIGGAKRAQHPARVELARRAAAASWSSASRAKRKLSNEKIPKTN